MWVNFYPCYSLCINKLFLARQTMRPIPGLREKECQWCISMACFFLGVRLGYVQLAKEGLDHVSALAWTMNYAGLWLQFEQTFYKWTIAQLIWLFFLQCMLQFHAVKGAVVCVCYVLCRCWKPQWSVIIAGFH